MEEAAVIALVKAGNADAFADIIKHYQLPIQRYLYRLTGDYELAQDLMQDTFIQAYKGILKTDSVLSFRAWLYRIATNNVYKQHRKRLLFLPFSSLQKDVELPAGNSVAETDESLAIQEVLAHLPKEQRTCLVLHLVEGFKYREIAETLGISEDAVRMRVSRGKEAFQKLYRGGED